MCPGVATIVPFQSLMTNQVSSSLIFLQFTAGMLPLVCERHPRLLWPHKGQINVNFVRGSLKQMRLDSKLLIMAFISGSIWLELISGHWLQKVVRLSVGNMRPGVSQHVLCSLSLERVTYVQNKIHWIIKTLMFPMSWTIFQSLAALHCIEGLRVFFFFFHLFTYCFGFYICFSTFVPNNVILNHFISTGKCISLEEKKNKP